MISLAFALYSSFCCFLFFFFILLYFLFFCDSGILFSFPHTYFFFQVWSEGYDMVGLFLALSFLSATMTSFFVFLAGMTFLSLFRVVDLSLLVVIRVFSFFLCYVLLNLARLFSPALPPESFVRLNINPDFHQNSCIRSLIVSSSL